MVMRLFPFPHATLYVLQLEHSPQLSDTFRWKEKPTTFATHKDSWNKKEKELLFNSKEIWILLRELSSLILVKDALE